MAGSASYDDEAPSGAAKHQVSVSPGRGADPAPLSLRMHIALTLMSPMIRLMADVYGGLGTDTRKSAVVGECLRYADALIAADKEPT